MTLILHLYLVVIVLKRSSQFFIVMIKVLRSQLFILQNFIGRNCSNGDNDRERESGGEKHCFSFSLLPAIILRLLVVPHLPSEINVYYNHVVSRFCTKASVAQDAEMLLSLWFISCDTFRKGSQKVRQTGMMRTRWWKARLF